MSDSTAGTPAPESGSRDQGPTSANDPELQAAAARDEHDVDDDLVLHDDLDAGVGGPAGPHSAGDTLGGAQDPTGNDGTMGADAPTGDASLTGGDLGAGALPGGDDTPSEVYGQDGEA